MKYVFHPRYIHGRKLDANACASVIGKIINGGKPVEYDEVIKKASRPTSPLHDAFTWDDGEAATMWRHEEAKQLFRFLYVATDTGEASHRAFLSLRGVESSDEADDEPERRRIWVRTDAAIQDRALRDAVLATALAELESFRRKYAHLTELSEVFAAADRLQEVTV